MRFRRFREKHDTSLLNTGDTKTTSGQDTPNAAAEDDEEQTPKSKKTPVKKTSAKKDSSKKTSAKKRKLSEAAEDEAVQSPIKGEPEEDEDVCIASYLKPRILLISSRDPE